MFSPLGFFSLIVLDLTLARAWLCCFGLAPGQMTGRQ